MIIMILWIIILHNSCEYLWVKFSLVYGKVISVVGCVPTVVFNNKLGSLCSFLLNMFYAVIKSINRPKHELSVYSTIFGNGKNPSY